jgi:hypothetical protein
MGEVAQRPDPVPTSPTCLGGGVSLGSLSRQGDDVGSRVVDRLVAREMMSPEETLGRRMTEWKYWAETRGKNVVIPLVNEVR